jgi:hypothetical protein
VPAALDDVDRFVTVSMAVRAPRRAGIEVHYAHAQPAGVVPRERIGRRSSRQRTKI